MQTPDDEERLLRSVALQNASTIRVVRQRAEEELLRTREALRQNQERLHAALTAAGTGTFRWNMQTNEVDWDGNLDRLFGLETPQPRQSLETFVAAVHPDDRPRVIAGCERSALDGSDFDMEFRVVWPDGSVHWLADRAKAFPDEHGRPLYMTGACADITARKRAEDALRDSEARYRRLAAALQEETRVLELVNETGKALASTLDLHSLVQAVTDAATDLSGAQFGAFFYTTAGEGGDVLTLYTLSGAPREAFEKFGHPRATALFGPTFRGEAPIRVDDVLEDPRYGTMAPHHGMPKGHLPVRSYLAVPVRSRSGAVVGGLFFGHPEPGVFSDRTERVIVGVAAQAGIAIDNAQLYEAAQKAADERMVLLESERAARTAAERLSEVKDEFLATLSHELRTPLNAILGWAQVLRSSPKDKDDLLKGLETIERNARVQTQLIEDLLDMSRITSGKLRLDIQSVQPAAFIEAAIETVHPAASAKGIMLEAILDPAAGSIQGDPGRLQQVVWNLLANAIKFTPKDGRVQVVLERVNSHIDVIVADTGVGIRPEFLPHLFERFRQGDASTTRAYGGLGLGLSIVKSLVELHGGTIEVKSPGEGRGTTVTVSLPVAVSHRAAAARTGTHPEGPKGPAGTKSIAELTGLIVLVVDDQPDARDLVRRILEDCGAEVFAAGTAADGLSLVQARKPHVMIADVGMPEGDGYDLLRRVRALGAERGGRVPAIALTAFARSEDRTRALRAGFAVHVAKPVNPAELVATVASVAGRVDQES
ncbi:MAG: ATP-binding protein [Acidobacteriota bacterium]|nr:ATP-binding protein [Acidobacteriota bacterium]